MSEDPDRQLAAALGAALIARRWTLASAESLTGGGIAACCTGVAGASDWFAAGLVTYTAAMKQRLLEVPAALISRHGVVSEPVARAMAEGAWRMTGAELTLAVTGIAGPGGGEVLQPVGTVWFAWAHHGRLLAAESRQLEGDRDDIRAATVHHALNGALLLLAE